MMFKVPPNPIPPPEPEPEWIQPGDALARVEAAMGERDVAMGTLIGRLKQGLIRATFERHGWENVTNPPKVTSNVIEPRYWNHFSRGRDSFNVWKSGDLRLYVGAAFSNSMIENDGAVTFFRVKIERQGIEEIVANASPSSAKRVIWKKAAKIEPPPAPVPAATAQQPEKNQGGRPRKEWWDDFWIDICHQIYEGDLKPKTQADLERAMLGWATNHGHEMSEPTAKIAARKLFKAWKLGG